MTCARFKAKIGHSLFKLGISVFYGVVSFNNPLGLVA